MNPQKPRAGKKLLLATSFGVALIAGVAAVSQNLDATPQIFIPAPPIPPKPNGFDVYVRAAKMLVRANPAVDENNDVNPPTDPKIRAQKYSLANKEVWLKQNAVGFALFQTALNMKCRNPTMRDVLNPFPVYARFREMARGKATERKAREMRGDWNGAAQSQIDTVQMGNGIARGGSTVAALVGVAVNAIGRDNSWQIVQHLNARQSRTAISRLETIFQTRISAADALQEEKWFSLSLALKAMRDNIDWRKTYAPVLSPPFRVTVFPPSKRTVIERMERAYDVQIANARLPYSSPKMIVPPSDPITEMLTSSVTKFNAAVARNDAGNALWLTTLALRAYKLEKGAYPATLRVLVPSYLKQIPADPFGKGEILRYKLAGKSYVLWSIGPDGIDNNGTPAKSTRKPRAREMSRLPIVNSDSKGDYVAGKNR